MSAGVQPVTAGDMFDQPAPSGAEIDAAIASTIVIFTGSLARNAEVRSKPIDAAGHIAPVLCIELLIATPCPHVVRAERPYTEATRKQAEADAARLKKGQRVSVSSPLLGMRVYLPAVEVLPPEQTTESTAA